MNYVQVVLSWLSMSLLSFDYVCNCCRYGCNVYVMVMSDVYMLKSVGEKMPP